MATDNTHAAFLAALRRDGYTVTAKNGWVEVQPAPPVSVILEIQKRNKGGALLKEIARHAEP